VFQEEIGPPRRRQSKCTDVRSWRLEQIDSAMIDLSVTGAAVAVMRPGQVRAIAPRRLRPLSWRCAYWGSSHSVPAAMGGSVGGKAESKFVSTIVPRRPELKKKSTTRERDRSDVQRDSDTSG
jgi:hypothetical protein